MQDEILIRFKDHVSDAEINAIVRSYGAEVLDYIEEIKVYRLRVPEGQSVGGMIESCANDPACEYAERNYVGSGGDVVPNDTFFFVQWHLDNDGQTGGNADADIDAVEGWQITRGDPTVVVAVLDTGIESDHPEFQGRLLSGFDFVNEDADPEADHPHGVLVSGIIAANSDNDFAGAGIDHKATILPVKVLDQNNFGTTTDLAQGLIFAANQGAHVINMSLINYPLTSMLNDALQFARDAGSILIACAGNGGIGNADVSGPGVSPLTISVGATDHNDLRAGFSGTGTALDLVAPGLSVRTTAFDTAADQVSLFSGCSAATPVVSGVATLLLSIDPSLSHDQVRDILTATADDLVGSPDEDAPGRDDFFGFGRVNLNNALLDLVTPVAVDIMPRRCPNRLVVGTRASSLVLTAILGTDAFNVTQVDIASVRLGGAVPVAFSITGLVRDVASPFFPFLGKQDAKDCTRRGRDRHDDLLLLFDREEIAAGLGPVSDRDVVVLPLTGHLFDGTAILGEDVVRIRVPRSARRHLVQSDG